MDGVGDNKLSPAEQALVDQAKPKPDKEVSIQVLDPDVSEPKQPTGKNEDSSPPEKKRTVRTKKTRKFASQESGEVVLVTESFKLRKDLQERLLRASFERKMSREAPFTKQGIINEAIETWLDTQGF